MNVDYIVFNINMEEILDNNFADEDGERIVRYIVDEADNEALRVFVWNKKEKKYIVSGLSEEEASEETTDFYRKQILDVYGKQKIKRKNG